MLSHIPANFGVHKHPGSEYIVFCLSCDFERSREQKV